SKSISEDHRLIVRIDGTKEENIKLIEGIQGVISVSADFEREPGVFEYIIETDGETDIRKALFERVAEKNRYILELKSAELTLEDIFLKVTAGEDITAKGGKK
ncbi:MAG: ABC transporter, partial [Oscillospiraceae bacterium]|nr:ABC transporter [Oscillospiraceae bacterium]